MKMKLSFMAVQLMLIMPWVLTGCTTFQNLTRTNPPPPPALLAAALTEPASAPRALPESDLVEMSVLVTSDNVRKVKEGSRIVIAGIGGQCATELKNALMRRLVDNAKYDVLSRDQLKEIIIESEQQWAGKFNTKTAVDLGELLGASLFLVGDVVYCGQQSYPYEDAAVYNPEEPYDIFAVLQIVDIRTGKVILSSSNEGTFFPGASPLLFSANPEEYARLGDETATVLTDQEERAAKRRERLRKARETASRIFQNAINIPGKVLEGAIPDSLKGESAAGAGAKKSPEEINYPAFKASEDLANGFADKFFARPTWEKVEMWASDYWRYGDSVRYVKLGHCPIAVQLMETVAKGELSEMPDRDVAEYLHNYGVALLCANQPERALEKLRSSYRIGYHPSTLRMLGLASQVMEWSLDVKIDEQPEVDMLIDRSVSLLEN